GRLLPQPGRPHGGLRAVRRWPTQLDRFRAGEQDGGRHRALLTLGLRRVHNRAVETAYALNRSELQRYLNRVGDRWPIRIALLGGARVDDARGALPQRERGPEYVLVLVSAAFDGMPWLERVYQASALWDALEMGDAVTVHCYTPAE